MSDAAPTSSASSPNDKAMIRLAASVTRRDRASSTLPARCADGRGVSVEDFGGPLALE
jgi:hypothetical protein